MGGVDDRGSCLKVQEHSMGVESYVVDAMGENLRGWSGCGCLEGRLGLRGDGLVAGR